MQFSLTLIIPTFQGKDKSNCQGVGLKIAVALLGHITVWILN